MNWLMKGMKTNSNLRAYPGVNYVKQRLRSEPQNIRSLFESTSFVIPSNRNTTHRSFNSDVLRDTSTQTSKTVVSLDFNRSPRMSPDSLSPKTEYQKDTIQEEYFSLDGGVTDGGSMMNAGVPFSRKNCILRYLHRPRSRKEDYREHTFPENSLTKAFLEKARKKTLETASPRITRSNFLQQTSPLRNITSDASEHFKSHSYAAIAEDYLPNTKTSNTRFKIKRVKEKAPAVDNIKPVKYYCEKELSLNLNTSSRSSPKNNKNHSFMSPTFSSEQKNKLREIKHVTELISPTRRGRSASPKANAERSLSQSPSIAKKVPYIDKSSSSIFHGTGDALYDLKMRSPRLELSTSTIMENYAEFSPEHDLGQAIAKLRDVDWNISLRGLAEVIEVCRSSDTNIIFPHMTVINQRIIDLLKSPRSHVCRTTCKAVGHLFEYIKDTRRPEFDEIVDTLLCRTADSNKFIRHDANLALDCMVTHIPILHAVRSLCAKGPDHKNALVRIATARLVVCAVVMAGSSSILNPGSNDYTRRRIILNMVKFLNDKTLEARKYGERLYKLLSSDKMFDLFMRRYLEKETIQKINICFKAHAKNGVR